MMRPDAKVEKVYLYPKPVKWGQDHTACRRGARVGTRPTVNVGLDTQTSAKSSP